MAWSLYTAAQVRELDRLAIEEHGIPGLTLMQRAGRVAFTRLQQRWPDARRVCVLCGLGNNAGDGYILARLAHEAGLEVEVVQLGEAGKLKGDANSAHAALLETGIAPSSFSGTLPQADVYVDALLGTGLDRELEGDWRTVIESLNSLDGPVLAIDIPSGLHADNGIVMGVSVCAVCTVTFIGRKRGLYTGAGADHCGTVIFEDLQVPEEIYTQVVTDTQLVSHDDFRADLTPRPRSAHKGHFGHVLVVGGDHGFSGAVRMAAEAAARTGAGLVSVATREHHAALINSRRPELMCHAVEDVAALVPLLEKASVVAIGPGLGQSGWSSQLLARVLESDLPLVLDADALNLLAADPVQRPRVTITPHPGEAARLLGSGTRDIQANRFAAAGALQSRYGGVVVLKGSGTIVTDHSQQHRVCAEGNPGMATGGMGDVLTGVIAGLQAQGFGQAHSAIMGVCLHARAADQAAFVGGERGLLATDLMPHIRKLLNPDS